MPNVVGLNLQDAQTSLTNAGILVPSSIGYFGNWPITVNWLSGTFDVVTAQNPSSGTTNIVANSAVTLSVGNPKLSIAYP